MENSSDNLKDLYREFATIDEYFYVTNEGQVRVDTQHESILQYCNYENTSGKYTCDDYFQLTICSVIHLLKNYKKYKLEDDKFAEYVILWLSYKLNTVEDKCATNLNDFYTNHIEKNECYNKNINGDDNITYKKIIDKIKDLMNIKEISKFNGLFSILFYLYYLFHGERLNCQQNLDLAKNFAYIFEDLIKDPNNIKGSLYTQILSTLSDDYNILINKYGENKCTNFKSLPELTPQKIPVGDSEQPIVLSPEATPSSSSILNTVIPVLSTFAIPVFLVVSYKYSLFGIDKLFQRQHLRNKLKKIKNKMELNI
ncbi:Plasmodium variant antigen protein Cir/Yir/Bir, putative [Plasmodium chabaudi adami]|uniref:Plasmodium variant antigen protein Cir/Yir/Bir, putative n=1 Tax=Plasmodium chabaudi adami TaxID=5826 RepID=A0A1D3L8Y9_PLACE|nr:Plasmodium variant antigen protein Cir/Yir/Bir, putative [Plasmodium chabaudi adami]